jgi:hypothetical protein
MIEICTFTAHGEVTPLRRTPTTALVIGSAVTGETPHQPGHVRSVRRWSSRAHALAELRERTLACAGA